MPRPSAWSWTSCPAFCTTLVNATLGAVTVAPYSSAASLDMGVRTVEYIGDKRAVILQEPRRRHPRAHAEGRPVRRRVPGGRLPLLLRGPRHGNARAASPPTQVAEAVENVQALRAGQEMTRQASPAASFRWGIYEKALPLELAWPERLAAAAAAGYQFVEISIDESDEQAGAPGMARGPPPGDAPRRWPGRPHRWTRCASAPTASSRWAAPPRSCGGRRWTIMRRAIDFAAEFGIRIIQVAGYDVHYEESTERTRALYLESILQSAEWARRSCVTLALENVECPVVDSIEKGMGVRAGGRHAVVPDVPRHRQPHRHGEGRDARAPGRRAAHRGGPPEGHEDPGVPPGAVRRGARGLRRRVPDPEADGVHGARSWSRCGTRPWRTPWPPSPPRGAGSAGSWTGRSRGAGAVDIFPPLDPRARSGYFRPRKGAHR